LCAIAHGVYIENRKIEIMDVSDYPDFSSHGYQVIRELGRNREAGRITYQATAQNLDQQVVIKEFRFALADANWSGFKAYQREIEMLQQLEHPRIPRYLDCFETQVGFCLVQEYKNAPSLVERRSFNPEDIKQIAVSVLEILVYLQQRVPSIIHRDIKPENILVDKQLNAYLVDFGFARIRGGELALSSVAAGTPGFMPPEEQFGRPLTEASDLYSLGATLICLLTGTRSVDIGTLIDDDYRFDFKKLVPKLNPRFISWLEKMVAPNVKQRFDNATVALESLNWERFVDSPNCVESLESLVGVVKGRERTNVLALPILSVVAGVRRIFIVPRLDSQLEQLLNTKRSPGCNFQDADLKGADLKGADLKGANLSYAKLEGANLSYAKLEGANLSLANLGGANMSYAKLEGANLSYTKLGFANLRDAKLKGANLSYAKLVNANLMSANLENANLENANLRNANLENANLENAKLGNANLSYATLGSCKLGNANLSYATLEGAYLEGATLEGAYLEGAILGNAYLRNANLKNANLKRANLRDANLEGANLRNAILDNAKLESAKLKGAIMPDGIKHP
jgi:uncharacterized protein YjbI with pentapeptide repeats